MALIKCPNCGKEVSDKASKCIQCGHEFVHQEKRFCSECGTVIPDDVTQCPNCGCPIEDISKQDITSGSINQTVGKKKNLAVIILPIVAVVLIAVVGVIFYNIKIVQPKKIEAQNKATYDEAIELLEKGKYAEANELFDTIKNYNDVETIQEQLKYESYAYSAINSLKKYLKNPDSYQPYEITFYSSMGNETGTDENTDTENEEEKYPVCIMHYGAQNGFGGNTTGYALCSYNSESEEYELLGTCDSLDEDDYDKDDEDEVYDFIICGIIKLYRDGEDTVGNIDLARLKTVLKNDAYSTIKIIE